MKKIFLPVAALTALVMGGGANAGTKIGNDISRCSAGKGPAVLVTVRGIKKPSGRIRMQSYRASKAEWLKKGRVLLVVR